jgi:hypothetical protein
VKIWLVTASVKLGILFIMFTLLVSGFLFLFLFRTPVSAQVPLIYQLLEAYHPDSTTEILAKDATPSTTPTPIISKPAVNIAVLGDSMIDTLGSGIPQLTLSLKQYFPGRQFRLLNYGVGSSDIEYGIYRITHDYEYLGSHIPSLASQNPDIVVIESFAYNNYGNSEASINRYHLDLTTLVNTLKDQLPHAKIVLAATVAPNSIVFGNGAKDLNFTALDKIDRANTIKLYLQNMINFANSGSFILANAYSPSLFGNEGLTDYINSTDHIHPSAHGGQFFCDTVADTIYRNKLIN